MRVQRWCCCAILSLAAASAREPAGWIAAHSSHFEVFSDAGADSARGLAEGLERLHSFFARQLGMTAEPRREVRVIAFAGAQEYAQYRTRTNADAYFIGTENRDYIVLPAPARGDLRVAAHEYAHVLMHT